MRRLCLVALVALACDSQEHAPKVERAVKTAEAALDKAEEGVRKGYDKAEKGVRKGYDKAEKGVRKGYDKAEKGVRKGYGQARERVQAVDWVQAFDDTKATVERAADAVRPPSKPNDMAAADAWWTRGPEAVSCDTKTRECTVSAWFVTAARDSPTRLIGDVKVLTALDDSGWLLDAVHEGTAAHAMGFRKGDIVRTVGGHPLTDGWARVKVLETLRSKDRVEVVLVRVGQSEPETFTVIFERVASGHTKPKSKPTSPPAH